MSGTIAQEDRGNQRTPRLACLVLAAGIVFAGSGAAWAARLADQGQKTGDPPCGEGVVGYLGITSIDCVACSLTVTKEPAGWKRAWSMTIEPRITEIAPDSPAAGVLQVRDEIVGIDGVLITSAEGGRRFASIEPGQNVTIRYRRRGRAVDVVIQARPRCGLFVEGFAAIALIWSEGMDRLVDLARGLRIQLNDSGQRSVSIWGHAAESGERVIELSGGDLKGLKISPRKRVVEFSGGDLEDLKISPKDPVTGRPEISMGEGRLGLRWSLREGTSSSIRQKDGRRVWQFSKPLRVSGIEVGGAADVAGVRIGDEITAVNGYRIDSRRGGEEFSDLRPGRSMRLTLRGTDRSERTVTVVPRERQPDAPPE